LGNPIGFFLTGGEAHDLAGADHLLPTMEADTLIADKAFDADARVLEPLAAAGKTAVIPPRTNRSLPRDYDRELYAARTHLVETSILVAHEGIARWCGIGAVGLLCASGTSGRWHGSTRASITELAHDDRTIIDAWHSVATRIVLTHRAAITRVAEALLMYGTLDGNDLLRVAHAPDPVPTPHASEAEDQAQVAEWQRVQKLVQMQLRCGLS
jgi:transposase